MDNHKSKNQPIASANTLAILDAKRKAAKSQVTIATETGVLDAKDWVDNVEK